MTSQHFFAIKRASGKTKRGGNSDLRINNECFSDVKRICFSPQRWSNHDVMGHFELPDVHYCSDYSVLFYDKQKHSAHDAIKLHVVMTRLLRAREKSPHFKPTVLHGRIREQKADKKYP